MTKIPNLKQIKALILKLNTEPDIHFSEFISDRIACSGDMSGSPFYHWRWKHKCLPDLVIWPNSEQQVQKIIKWLFELKIPYTQRGGASSYFGEAVPTMGGVILDLKRMNHFSVEIKEEWINAEAGTRFFKIQQELKQNEKYNSFELATVPSSAPSATIGGWIATGAKMGIGSYKYDALIHHILQINVISPTGELQTITTKEDLNQIFGSCGIFGTITKIKIRIQARTKKIPIALNFSTYASLFQTLKQILDNNNPDFVELKDNVHTIRFSNHYYSHLELNSYNSDLILLIVFSGLKASKITQISQKITSLGGKLCSVDQAKYLWKNRFNHEIRLKIIAPVIMTQHILIPKRDCESILSYFSEKCTKLKIQFAYTAFLSKKHYFRLVLSIPTNNQHWNHFLASKAILHETMKFAYLNHGRCYACGLQNTMFMQKYEKKKFQNLKSQKKIADHQKISNPFKITDTKISFSRIQVMFSLILLWRRCNLMTKKATILEFKNSYFKDTKTKRNDTHSKINLIKDDLKQCAYCSICRDSCPSYISTQKESYSPSGRMRIIRTYLERDLPINDEFINVVFSCTTCNQCMTQCPNSLNYGSQMENIRNYILENPKNGFQKHRQLVANVQKMHNVYGELQKDHINWDNNYQSDPNIVLNQKFAFFVGCTATYRDFQSAQHVMKILEQVLDQKIITLGKDEACCGSPLLRTGQNFWINHNNQAKKNPSIINPILHNIQALKDQNIDEVIFSCSGCFKTASTDWELEYGKDLPFITKHFTQLLARMITTDQIFFDSFPYRVTYHDPCHLGRYMGVYEEPRTILRAIPNLELIEMDHIKENALCCGAGGGVKAGIPEIALKMSENRIEEAINTGSKILVTSCVFCKRNLQDAVNKLGVTLKIVNIEDLIVKLIHKKSIL